MLLRVRLCACADTRVHSHIAATHVPGSVCVNAHAHGAHPRSAQASTQAHTHLVPAPQPPHHLLLQSHSASSLLELKVTGVPGWAEGRGTLCSAFG